MLLRERDARVIVEAETMTRGISILEVLVREDANDIGRVVPNLHVIIHHHRHARVKVSPTKMLFLLVCIAPVATARCQAYGTSTGMSRTIYLPRRDARPKQLLVWVKNVRHSFRVWPCAACIDAQLTDFRRLQDMRFH